MTFLFYDFLKNFNTIYFVLEHLIIFKYFAPGEPLRQLTLME